MGHFSSHIYPVHAIAGMDGQPKTSEATRHAVKNWWSPGFEPVSSLERAEESEEKQQDDSSEVSDE